MKLTSPILTSAIRGLLVPAFSLSVCSVALGQNAPAQAPQQNTPAPQQQKKNNIAIQLGNVLVTGSHIPSSTVVTAQPITIISSKQIAATGLQTIGQLLQQMPAVSPTMNSTFNFESNGASNLDLRYLGANRILVLVNGQRWVTSIDGTTDLNSIPLSIVDHIEVLKAGASSIYGSDAISGVVNIVLIKNINGGKASAYYGIWHGDGHWDGQTQQYSFTVGANGDKSGWLFSGSYNRNLRIPGVDRTFSSEPVPGTGVSRGSSATPQPQCYPSRVYGFDGPAMSGHEFRYLGGPGISAIL
jgi:iron complex outermembrane recepter protein